MINLLVTGATGNIGMELISHLQSSGADIKIIAGVRDINKARQSNKIPNDIDCRRFDFEDPDTHRSALHNIDIVFLLRPPHLSNIKKHVEPFISTLSSMGIKKVVFLSVQGAEKSTLIPHRKIEQLIIKYGLEYIFIRPSYFMQNLTSTLLREIQEQRTITLPSGTAKFNWININDIAKLASEFLIHFEQYKNREYTVSGSQNLNYDDVVSRINTIAHTQIKYIDANPFTFFFKMKALGFDTGMIGVMFILHTLPKIQGDPEIATTYQDIMKEPAGTLEAFIENNQQKFS